MLPWDSLMIRIQLPPADAARLEHLFRVTADRKLRDRLQIVLMPPGIAASRSTNRRGTTRTWGSSGCPATARS